MTVSNGPRTFTGLAQETWLARGIHRNTHDNKNLKFNNYIGFLQYTYLQYLNYFMHLFYYYVEHLKIVQPPDPLLVNEF